MLQKPKIDAGRIVNGQNAAHINFPFVVSIEVFLQYSSEWSSTCGGSIVNKETILTACHCVTADEKIHGNIKYMADPKTLRVVAGTSFWAENTPTKQVSNVQRLVTHPKCKNFYQFDKSFMNDVALVYLSKPLSYNEQVGPLPLPSTSMPEALRFLRQLAHERAVCTIVGWGRTVESDPAQAQSLQSASVYLLTPDECRHRFCTMVYDHCETDFESHAQICVASPTSSDCYGDSGGPLICNGVVVGTTSYGDRCLPNLPTVYQGLQPILEVLAVNKVKIDYKGFEGATNLGTTRHDAKHAKRNGSVIFDLSQIHSLLGTAAEKTSNR